MTRLLIDDVERLQSEVGAGVPDPSDLHKANRRFYIRAVFALIEAFAEQHRRLLLDLADANKVTIKTKALSVLREIREVTLPDGSVEERQQYLQLYEKIRTVY